MDLSEHQGHSCTFGAAKIHTIVAQPWPGLGHRLGLIWVSAATGCGCDLNRGILRVLSFLLAFRGRSYRAAAVVGAVVGVGRRTNGLVRSP